MLTVTHHALFAIAAAIAGIAACGPKEEAGGHVAVSPTTTAIHLDSARELDRQGVRAFTEGRYREAVQFFRGAFRLGGPPSELWNIARSLERLDEPEGAAQTIVDYLAQQGLTTDERTEAQRELDRLRARPSALTVISFPSGASVTVDGAVLPSVTPASAELAAGAHTIVFRRDGFEPHTQRVEAKYGRAIVVEVSLTNGAKGTPR